MNSSCETMVLRCSWRLARLWTSLGFYSKEKGGKFVINSVTGPDEYKAVVNNNAYTNLMARENLRYAAQTVELLRATDPDAYNTLVHRTALELDEPQRGQPGRTDVHPFDEQRKIIPQDDSFLEREPWDLRTHRLTTIPFCCSTTR